jgi:hypothetical protein
MNAITNLVGLLLAGVMVLPMLPASAQHTEKWADSPYVGGPPVLSLRTRIPLPGVYGRIDHYGWDGKRANLIVSALGNDTVEIVEACSHYRGPGASAGVRLSAGRRSHRGLKPIRQAALL